MSLKDAEHWVEDELDDAADWIEHELDEEHWKWTVLRVVLSIAALYAFVFILAIL